MTVLYVIAAALLTEALFVVVVRKLHDRSIHQMLSRTVARFGW
jgi:hypothetical protein